MTPSFPRGKKKYKNQQANKLVSIFSSAFVLQISFFPLKLKQAGLNHRSRGSVAGMLRMEGTGGRCWDGQGARGCFPTGIWGWHTSSPLPFVLVPLGFAGFSTSIRGGAHGERGAVGMLCLAVTYLWKRLLWGVGRGRFLPCTSRCSGSCSYCLHHLFKSVCFLIRVLIPTTWVIAEKTANTLSFSSLNWKAG